MARAPWSRLEIGALAVIGAGIVARVWAAASLSTLDWDVAWYATMARTLLDEGAFLQPATGGPTHHYPPLYPLLLAAVFRFVTPSLGVIQAVSVTLGLAFILVTFLATRDLYGRTTALVVAAVVAGNPVFINLDATGYPEGLLGLLYVVTMWSVLRSLDRPRLIVVGGLAAGLAYLTKASMGPFLLLAAGGGLAWRLQHRGRGVFRDVWYLAAGLVFLAFVAAWTFRNVSLFGLAGWETQPHASASLRFAFRQDAWPEELRWKLVEAGVLLCGLALPVLSQIPARPLAILRDERRSALWLAVVLPSIIAAFFALAFHFSEGRPRWDPADARYYAVVLVPLLWLALGEGRATRLVGPRRPLPPAARVAVGAALVVGGVLLAAEIEHLDLPIADVEQARAALVAVPLVAGAVAVALGARRLDHAIRCGAALVGLGAYAVIADESYTLILQLGGAGALALLVAEPSARAVAFAALLILPALSGTIHNSAWAPAFEETGALMRPGDTLAVAPRGMHYAVALAPPGVEVVRAGAPSPDFLLVWAGEGPSVPSGYRLVTSVPEIADPLPVHQIQSTLPPPWAPPEPWRAPGSILVYERANPGS